MPLIQLSKLQTKFHAHMEARARREAAHDERFPSKEAKQRQSQARIAEVQLLTAEQAKDAASEAQAYTDAARVAAALTWQAMRKLAKRG